MASSKYQTLKLDFMDEAIAWEKICGPRGFPCCTPESDQIKLPLAIWGVGEPYVNDTSLNISEQLIMHLH